MRLNDFRIKAFLIFVTAVCLSVTGCSNAAADYEGAATKESEVISEDFSSLDSLKYNDEPTPGQAGDFLLSDLYVDNQYDYTVYDCYKKNDE